MSPTADAAQLCGIIAIVGCAIEFARTREHFKIGPRASRKIRLNCRGPGPVTSRRGNQVESISVYGTTGLEPCAERIL